MCRFFKALALALAFLMILPAAAFAADAEDIPVTADNSMPVDIDARAAILVDAKSGQVLAEKNADAKLDVTSTVKIMSMLLFMEAVEKGQLDLSQKIEVSKNAAGMGGMQAFLDAGSEYPAAELLKAVGCISANDACIALVEKVAGTEEVFVERMNAKALELGLQNTHFVNSTGHKAVDGQYSSARDLAKMALELLKYPSILTYTKIWMDTVEHKGGRITELANPNRLVRDYTGADGLQTGSSSSAGYSVVGTAKRGETRLVCVVIGAANNQARFAGATKLLDYGLANFVTVTPLKKSVAVENVKVDGGDKKTVDIVPKEDFSCTVKKGEEKGITFKVELGGELKAPLKAGETVGIIKVMKGDTNLGTVPAVVSEEVKEKGFLQNLLKIIRVWLNR